MEVPTGPPPRPSRALDVLVADDNPVNRTVLSRYLERDGHRPTLVTNGREALTAIQSRQFDVALMDIQMEEMDGLEAARAIRAYERERGTGRPLPLVAVTALAMIGDRERCLAAGFDEHLTKPVSLDSLVRTLGALFPSFDRAAALARVDGDEALLGELVDIFLAEVPGWLAQMESALATEDGATLHRVAHTLKGAAGQCGAHDVFERAFTVEKLAKETPFDTKAIVHEFDALRGAVALTLPAMRSLGEP